MTSILSNNILKKNWKAVFKTLQAFLLHKKNIYSENSISIAKKGAKLQLIKEIQISRHMNIYAQTLGVFKRENNEWSSQRLHKTKIVVFLTTAPAPVVTIAIELVFQK